MKRLSKSSWSILLQTVTGASCSVFILFLFLAPSARAIVDTNHNGVSDLWEKNHNAGDLFPAFDPQADSDGDGWTNAREATAGTNPFDPNPPDGYLHPDFVHSPETWADLDGDGVDEHIPEAVTFTWVTIPGKQYTFQSSPDLTEGSWFPVGEPFIGNGNEVEYGLPITGPVRPDKLFWRVAVNDIDNDGDGLTDNEEHELGTAPYLSDTDGDGVTDMEELLAGTDPTFPKIRNFARLVNGNGTITYTWVSDAEEGDWFHINESQPDGTWKVIFATTYGSQKLPYVVGKNHYVITLASATDFLP